MNFTGHQKAVINAPLGINLKVVAVPGSGKSTVLIYRIEKFLIADYQSKDMIIVMFNDDAVINFSEDLKKIDFMDVPAVKTYHSLGRNLCTLLERANLLNKANLIVDDRDYHDFYQGILIQFTPLSLVATVKPEKRSTAKQFARFVELTKTSLTSPESVFESFHFPDKFKIFVELYRHSEIERLRTNKRFFTDLIRDPLITCQNNVKAYTYITNRYRVVMVDEYQDASPICHELIKLVAGTKANINVVGDGDQAIYAFTGASPRFLLSEIDKDFPNVKLFSLPETFRYGHSVCLLANNCINNNSDRDDIMCISAVATPTKLTVANYTAEQVDTEHEDLIDEVTKWVSLKDSSYNDIAILVRSYATIAGLEFALIKNNIPYKLGSGKSYILECKEVQWLESILNIFCPENTPEMVGQALYIYLSSYTYKLTPALLSLPITFLIDERYDEALDTIKPLFKTLPRVEYIGLRNKIRALSKVDEHGYATTGELIGKISDNSAIISAVDRQDYSGANNGLRKFVAARRFISTICNDVTQALVKLRNLRNREFDLDKGQIEITTLHKSKGLAWPLVIMGFLEENILPNLSLEKDVKIERRLYYVGITRAKKQLTLHIPIDDQKLTKASALNLGSMPEVDYGKPFMASRFLYESNILASNKVASAIYKQAPPELGKTDNLDSFNRYLRAINMDFRLSGI